MHMEPTIIADNAVVDMAYVLHSQTGREIDRSVSPITFTQGQDQVLPGLGDALYGMSAGEEKVIFVAPAEGYGAYDEANVQRVPRAALPDGCTLSVGQRLSLHNRETGLPYHAYVIEIGPDHIVIDHNLPLAGQTLRFHVRIVDVRPASSGEPDAGL